MRVSRHEATFLQAEHAARKRRYQSENTCVAKKTQKTAGHVLYQFVT
jgi:hypothetical protein